MTLKYMDVKEIVFGFVEDFFERVCLPHDRIVITIDSSKDVWNGILLISSINFLRKFPNVIKITRKIDPDINGNIFTVSLMVEEGSSMVKLIVKDGEQFVVL